MHYYLAKNGWGSGIVNPAIKRSFNYLLFSESEKRNPFPGFFMQNKFDSQTNINHHNSLYFGLYIDLTPSCFIWGFLLRWCQTKTSHLVWLKSEPSPEWLLPLWAEPKLQTRGCLKPGARSGSDLRFFSFHWNFIFSSVHPCPSFQTSKLQLNFITAFSLTLPSKTVSSGSHSILDVWVF